MSNTDTARALVEKLAAAEEWPPPQLLDDILAQGGAAVEPLRELVRRPVHGWPAEASVCFAIDLLGSLNAVAAIPDLVPLFTRYDNETLQSLSTTLGVLGAPGPRYSLRPSVAAAPAAFWRPLRDATGTFPLARPPR